MQQGAGDGGQTGTGNPGHLGAFHGGEALAEGEVGGIPVAAVEEVTPGLTVEGLGHEVCLGEGEGGAVADCGVHTTVGVAAIDTLDSGCGIKFAHVVLMFNYYCFYSTVVIRNETAKIRKKYDMENNFYF
jgi:hypothetical protein